jgi:hypothetical protein
MAERIVLHTFFGKGFVGMLDIVERLNRLVPYGLDDCTVLADAADEIQRLRKELALLKMVRLSEDTGMYEESVEGG